MAVNGISQFPGRHLILHVEVDGKFVASAV